MRRTGYVVGEAVEAKHRTGGWYFLYIIICISIMHTVSIYIYIMHTVYMYIHNVHS